MTEQPPHIHISSAIVSVLPAHQDDVVRSLAQMPGVEVFHQASSKIVIVMEAPDSGVIGGRLAEIATLNGVLSANMVFEQAESLAELGE
jgi:nitrate reductase NapD